MKRTAMKTTLLALATSAAALLAGCVGGAYGPANTSRHDIENREKFVLLDSLTQSAVTCSGLQERRLADGRLEVSANVRNRENKRIQVQINCVFKDANGFSTGDETPFQTLILTENAQETSTFTSLNDKAQRYTIRVRLAR
ncbi:MAG: hypothetical protein EXS29_04840 [Pedosphaera sp.]|nr:hypothetical protein [Pedosphaera sp.]MST00620.1 hypothetical protein [Pedosphaera sp.]